MSNSSAVNSHQAISVARQLSDRVAQIELLGEFEKSIRSNKSVLDRQLLEQIIERCVSTFGIDAAMLFVEIDKTFVHAIDESVENLDSRILLRESRRETLNFVADDRSARLFHSDAGADASTLTSTYNQYSRVIVPLVDFQNHVVGSFTLLKHQSKGHFTRCDQSFAELLVERAAIIVRHNYDACTGLLNLAGFKRNLEKVCAERVKSDQEDCLMQIRFDQLGLIADSCGVYAFDDAVLQLSVILEKRIRKRDLAARTGNADFTLYLRNCTLADAEIMCNTLLDALKGFRFAFKDKLFGVNVAIGIVQVSSVAREVTALMHASDEACNQALVDGAGCYRLYSALDTKSIKHIGEISWADRIQEALSNDQLHLYCQPVVQVQNPDMVDHFDVLLRIRSTDGLLIAPSVFIGAAERCRMITQIDSWVIQHAFDALDAVYQRSSASALSLSINISGQTLNQTFPRRVAELMHGRSFPPSAIAFDLTEASALSNMKHLLNVVRILRKSGFKISIDNFGANVGSFTYLQNLEVDSLKIDGTLVRNMDRSVTNAAIVSSIHSVGRSMGLTTVAKFVESESVLRKLQELGLDQAQGHYFARPAPIDRVLMAGI